MQAAIDEDVPAPVITLSLLQRFVSRQEESFSAKVIAALRNEFGGHAVKMKLASSVVTSTRPERLRRRHRRQASSCPGDTAGTVSPCARGRELRPRAASSVSLGSEF